METKTVGKRYNNLDGLRALAAIGIICMHCKTNLNYEIIIGGGYCGLGD